MKNLVAVAVVAVGFSTTSCSDEKVVAVDQLPQDVVVFTYDVKEIQYGGGFVQGETGNGELNIEGEGVFVSATATVGNSEYDVAVIDDEKVKFEVTNDLDSNAYVFEGTYFVSNGKFLIMTKGDTRVQLEVVE